jgi:hypothetical protein
MFELTKATPATLTSVLNRSEDNVPGLAMTFRITTANEILDKFSPPGATNLRTLLYTTPPGQPEPLPGIEPTTPLLRMHGIAFVKGDMTLEGWSVTVKHGIEDESDVVMGGCKIDEFKVVPKQGGSVELWFRVRTSDVDPRAIGLMGIKLTQEVSLLIHAPKPKEDGLVIDGSVGHAGLAARRQAEAEAAGQQRLDGEPDEEKGNGRDPDDDEGSTNDAKARAAGRRAHKDWPFGQTPPDTADGEKDATGAFLEQHGDKQAVVAGSE